MEPILLTLSIMTVKALFSLVTEGFCDVQAHDKEQRLLQIHLLETRTLVSMVSYTVQVSLETGKDWIVIIWIRSRKAMAMENSYVIWLPLLVSWWDLPEADTTRSSAKVWDDGCWVAFALTVFNNKSVLFRQMFADPFNECLQGNLLAACISINCSKYPHKGIK